VDDLVSRAHSKLAELEASIALLTRQASDEPDSSKAVRLYADIERRKEERSRLLLVLKDCNDVILFTGRVLRMVMCFFDPTAWDEELQRKWEGLACTSQVDSAVLMAEAHIALSRLKTVVFDLEGKV